MQRQAGFVDAVHKLSRTLVQRLWQRVGVLLEGVHERGGLNGGSMRQRREERVPEDAHHIIVQDAVLHSREGYVRHWINREREEQQV